ncbi:MAG: putative ABC transporter ATP-binding protein [Chlamydiae bacterium]|nr:putative ABC transporter ATP-binding protein [Chlamydiota bacterium]
MKFIRGRGRFPSPFNFISRKVQSHIDKWRAFFHMASCFLPHVKKQSRLLFLSLIAGVFFTIVSMLEPWPLKLIFDNVFYNKATPRLLAPFVVPFKSDKLVLLNVLIVYVIVVATFRGIFYYFQQLLTSRAGQQIVSGVRVDLYSHLQRLSFSFHDRRRTGDMLARLTTDIRILRDILISLPLTITSELLLMVAMLSVMAVMDWQLTLMALMAVPVLILLMKKYRHPMKNEMRKQREREGHLTSIASEVLGAIKVVQGFHQEPKEVKRFSAQNTNSLKSGLKATRLEAKLKWASELTVAIVTAIILGVAGRRVLTGALSPGDLLVFVFYLKTFNRPLRRVSKITEQLARGTASGERILDLMQIEPGIEDLPHAIEAPCFRGEIRYENVWFNYKNGKPVLKDLNLTIEAGERVAIVGPTGSGKSTIVSLLSRFYEASSGRVLIDNMDVRDCTLNSLRKQISIVFQEPVLFATTIAENIAYGKPDATLEEIKQAAERAHIHQIIEALPEGYETVIGERGGTLSGGQRQCVAIARSLIKNAPIIILDEPTSGLDMFSAMLVMNALKELVTGKTVIIISHQQETIRDVDRVIELHNGNIVQEGQLDMLGVKP